MRYGRTFQTMHTNTGRRPGATVLGAAALLAAMLTAACATAQTGGGRQTISLDGIWEITDSVDGKAPPTTYAHHAPVPGLAHSAHSAFPNVDRFSSREYLSNMVLQGRLPASALTATAGIAHQARKYFWYRTYFKAPKRRARATLTVNKAQFGSEIWVNGEHVGGHVGCATSRSYDVTGVVRWSTDNEVVIRVGAHPGVLPEPNPCGIDLEKTAWTPGIYDSVSVSFTGAVMIESVQVAPHLNPRQIVVQTVLQNSGQTRQTVPIGYSVHPWREARTIGTAHRKVSVSPGETRTVTTTIPLPNARLWSPEQPNLNVVAISMPGDSVSTRFGMRELRFDTATRRAYLNGRRYFLRGSNITLHRFFEDPASKQLPWDDAWVHRLLGEKARQMHWNFMRFCIGPVPQRWLDIADEEGLMIQYEYPIWVGSPRLFPLPHVKAFDAHQLIKEFAAWMHDAWNHPSVVLWDASNESELPMLGKTVIPAVRGLDLSGRQWENSYNPPAGPDDPVEDHPYKFVSYAFPGLLPPFDMVQLETLNGSERSPITPPTGHAMILNEYGWLWLNRDGSPTELTKRVYEHLPYPHATAEERFATQAYLLAGLTEYWRAFRNYAAVMHFVYLSGSVPGGFTADNFADVTTLKLQPDFKKYVGEAFKPLGVYINFWRRELPAGDRRDFQVMMINDYDEPVGGNLSILLEDASGRVVASSSEPFALAPNGQQTHFIRLALPDVEGAYWLKAIATPKQGGPHGTHAPTTSRRRLSLTSGKPTRGGTRQE